MLPFIFESRHPQNGSYTAKDDGVMGKSAILKELLWLMRIP